MKEVKFNLYSFNELSSSIRMDIADKQRWNVMEIETEASGDDYASSLKAFEEATGTNVYDYSVGYCTYHYKFDFDDYVMGNYDYPVCEEDVTGKLLWRWVNSFIDANLCGKYYSISRNDIEGRYHYLYRRSNVLMEEIEYGWCPFTGVCYDADIIDPIVCFYLHHDKFADDYSLKDLIGACYDSFFKRWHEEYKYYADDKDIIIECLENRIYKDTMFYENGVVYDGPALAA